MNIAKGSAVEVKRMYYIAGDLGYISENILNSRKEQIQLVNNSISKLKRYLMKR
jgi:four helix bundle protein